MIEFLKIVLLGVIASIVYGILHDQITTRVCLEYFTVFHVRVIHTNSPTTLALVWGVIATWWVGLILGVPVALFARIGRRPKLNARQLVLPIAVLMLVMGASSLVAGVAGYAVARTGNVVLWEPWASRIPVAKHAAFMADLWAHRTAYGVGYFGSIFLWGWCVYRRNTLKMAARRRAMETDAP